MPYFDPLYLNYKINIHLQPIANHITSQARSYWDTCLKVTATIQSPPMDSVLPQFHCCVDCKCARMRFGSGCLPEANASPYHIACLCTWR